MSTAKKEEERFDVRSQLETLMEEYVGKCDACAMSNQETADDITDVLCDASGRRIILDFILRD